MADSLNTPTLPKLHLGLSRRSLMREMAAAGMLAAASIAAVAAPERSEAPGLVPADDTLPQHREVREIVQEIEHFGHSVILFGGGICIGFGGPHREPIELWARFDDLDRPLLAEWLRLSGRIEPKSAFPELAVQS